MNETGFELHITDFNKFREFVEIIRDKDNKKIKELTDILKKSDDALLAAELSDSSKGT